MTHTDIINLLIEKYNYKSYLEIGLDNPNSNYNNIVCDEKECVDPFFEEDHSIYDSPITDEALSILTYRMTSDEFFEQNSKTYDIIFIDGLHTKEQVQRDIINSLKCLNKGGKIVVHDCIPLSYETQLVPRQTDAWNGDVWRAIPELSKQGIEFCTVDTDCGCCIINHKENPNTLEYIRNFDYEWLDYVEKAGILLHAINIDDFNRYFINND